ncbi:MAG: hypothetical protein ABFR62_08430 [Bacteroidota bacterium]
MRTLYKLFGIILFSMFLASCDKDDDITLNCDKEVIISEELYSTAPDDQLTIINLKIIDDCLKITFESSGCDGSSWEVKLIDSEEIMESYPIQRRLRLSLKNEEVCDAVIIKEMTFDISKLQVSGDKLLLNITNSGEQILYEYAYTGTCG